MKTILIILFSLVLITSVPIAFAHSGRTDAYGCHNCYTSYCYGEYHCHNSGYLPRTPLYVPSPTPTPTPINLTIDTSYEFDKNSCTYTVLASWNKPSSYSKYSVSAVKTNSSECFYPGPSADTVSTNYNFTNLSSGSYKINIKPGNLIKWDWYNYCVTINLPKIKPTLELEEVVEGKQKFISYNATCANTLFGDNGLAPLDVKEGMVKVMPQEETTYKFTATSIDDETESREIVIIPYIEPTIIPALSSTPVNADSQNEPASLGTDIAKVVGVLISIFIVYVLIKIDTFRPKKTSQ